jgi:hypothetical protein
MRTLDVDHARLLGTDPSMVTAAGLLSGAKARALRMLPRRLVSAAGVAGRLGRGAALDGVARGAIVVDGGAVVVAAVGVVLVVAVLVGELLVVSATTWVPAVAHAPRSRVTATTRGA